MQLEIAAGKETNEITGEEMDTRDYSAFGDLDGICGMVSEWFADNK